MNYNSLVPSQIIDDFLSSVLRIPIYQQYELDLAATYWRTCLTRLQLANVDPSQQILYTILDMYYSFQPNRFPYVAELISYLTASLFELQLDTYNRSVDELIPIMHHYVFHYGYIPSINDLGCIFEYELLHHCFPDINEIYQTMDRHLHLMVDPDDYHQTYKVTTNTKHLEHLQPIVYEPSANEENPVCGLCQEEIQPSQSIYVLPCCHQKFHATDTDCINSTIKTWLQTNNKCPMCKQEVILQPST